MEFSGRVPHRHGSRCLHSQSQLLVLSWWRSEEQRGPVLGTHPLTLELHSDPQGHRWELRQAHLQRSVLKTSRLMQLGYGVQAQVELTGVVPQRHADCSLHSHWHEALFHWWRGEGQRANGGSCRH